MNNEWATLSTFCRCIGFEDALLFPDPLIVGLP